MDTVFNDNLEHYLFFVHERHRAHERRAAGQPGPWSDDPTVANRKFCNMFRVIDVGSQFSAKELLGPDQPITREDAHMRAFLYRYTNKPEPFQYFWMEHGRYPLISDLADGTLRDTWYAYRDQGGTFFSGAYTMFVGTENRGMTRLDWAMGLTHDIHHPDGKHHEQFQRVLAADTQQERLAEYTKIPRVGDFMGMQVLVDTGYWHGEPDRENEFAAIGPGSKRGVKRVTDSTDWLGVMRDAQQLLHQLPSPATITLANGAQRKLSLTDVQNTFCEFDKYMRYRNQEAKGRQYRPAHLDRYPQLTNYVPTHWV